MNTSSIIINRMDGTVTEQRDVAWKELEEIRETVKANSGESTADEVRRIVAQRDSLFSICKLVQGGQEFTIEFCTRLDAVIGNVESSL